jgi:peptidoglycan/LPS O-acetylase OafA/YrhL
MGYSAARAGAIAYPAALAPSTSVASAYIGEVDALRCLAMTAVILQHCQLLPFGWTGVWLFFVISGFAITSSLLGSGRIKHTKPVLIRNFYMRRCLRIWPVYFLLVAGNIVAATSLGKGEIISALPWLGTFTYNYRMILDGEIWPANGHLWTISVEEQFYLVFPFLFAWLSKNRLAAALAVCVALGPVLRTLLSAWFGALPWDDELKAFAVMVFAPAHFDAFSLGALLALFRPFLGLRLNLARLLFASAFAAALVYACIYLTINAASSGFNGEAFRCIYSGILWGEGRQIWVYSAVTGLSAALIALILAGEGWLCRLCNLPLLQPIGRISYGGYVYHAPVLMLHHALFGGAGASSLAFSLGKFAFAYPLTLAIAFLSYRYFEAPILKLRTHFG